MTTGRRRSGNVNNIRWSLCWVPATIKGKAETCQVSPIHPGKPRNPDEPGLDELLARAELFH